MESRKHAEENLPDGASEKSLSGKRDAPRQNSGKRSRGTVWIILFLLIVLAATALLFAASLKNLMQIAGPDSETIIEPEPTPDTASGSAVEPLPLPPLEESLPPTPTVKPMPAEIAMTSHFFYSKLTDADLNRLTELLSCTAVTRGPGEQIVIETGGTDVGADIWDFLHNRIQERCGKPEYMHVLSIWTDDSCLETQIVVNGLDMTLEERQLVTDIKICSLVYAIMYNNPVESIRIVTRTEAGDVARVTTVLE